MPEPMNMDAFYVYLNDRAARPWARLARVAADPLPEVEVAEEVYHHFLNVLPPGYLRGGGFYVTERETGDVVSTYRRRGGQYFHQIGRAHV